MPDTCRRTASALVLGFYGDATAGMSGRRFVLWARESPALEQRGRWAKFAHRGEFNAPASRRYNGAPSHRPRVGRIGWACWGRSGFEEGRGAGDGGDCQPGGPTKRHHGLRSFTTMCVWVTVAIMAKAMIVLSNRFLPFALVKPSPVVDAPPCSRRLSAASSLRCGPDSICWRPDCRPPLAHEQKVAEKLCATRRLLRHALPCVRAALRRPRVERHR